MLGKIVAPFTDHQVEALNRFQTRQDVHPFTCPGTHYDDQGSAIVNCTKRELLATPDGWVCDCGQYTQDWAFAAMVPLAGTKEG